MQRPTEEALSLGSVRGPRPSAYLQELNAAPPVVHIFIQRLPQEITELWRPAGCEMRGFNKKGLNILH